MKLQVLLSVMNINDWQAQKKLANISSGMVMINQVTDLNTSLINYKRKDIVVESFRERGLSVSRNRAIRLSDAHICVIADGDVTYEDDYERTITDAFDKFIDADIIIFSIQRIDGTMMRVRPGRVGILHSMKVNSKLIAFRRESITGNGIAFDVRFGAGTDFYMGEENIFLSDCRRKGLKIISHPVQIAHLRPHVSTWPRERNEKYFYNKGRMFHRISPIFAYVLCLQFALRKSGKRNESIGIPNALRAIFKGAHDEAKS